MVPSRSILILLAFLFAAVSAAPLHRRSCRHVSVPKPSPTAAPVSIDPTPEPSPDPEVPEEEPEEPESPSRPSSIVAVPSRSASPSKSASNSAPAPSKTPDEPETEQPTSGLMGKLLPRKVNEYWTTAKGDDKTVSMSDSTLRPHHAMSSLKRDYVEFNGKSTVHAHYAKGSYAYRGPAGGLSFYSPGPSSVDLTKAKEAWFGYSIYFPKDFNWVLGGKLFGLYGGNSDGEAVGCSGGRRSSACFSTRLMWRTDAQGEFYTYLPPYTDSRFKANKAQCDYPNSDCNPTYGASIGRGEFHFTPGAWYTVSQRVKLNDVGEANGEIELFANGKSVISLDGLILRDSAAGRIRGIQAQTFFGGSKTQFQAAKAEDVYFADLTVGISQYL